MSIETLPVELFHCILDNLDTETIVFSVRHVCRLFRSFVKTYDRYIVNLISISKRNYYLLCRLINPHHVISLKLANEERTTNQIDLFISLVRLRQFTRLHSITLLNIKEYQLNFILKRINLNLLTSFSFNINRYDDRRIKTTNKYLRSIVSQLNFRKMEFNLNTERLSKFSWPYNCSIQYLVVNENITMDNLSIIFQCSPHLHKIILKQKLEENIVTNVSLKSTPQIYFPQLTSLTMEKLPITIAILESFLSLTPSLVYLKLIGEHFMFDGKRWEQFIEINLLNLDKFEFYLDYWSLEKKTSADLELIIASFRTPFWIEHKKWFVTCACNIKRSQTIYLYSEPICKSCLNYDVELHQNSLFNYTTTMNNHQCIKNDVNSFNLSLNKVLANYIDEKLNFNTELYDAKPLPSNIQKKLDDIGNDLLNHAEPGKVLLDESKFRLHSIDTKINNENNSIQLVLNLGLTDYKLFICIQQQDIPQEIRQYITEDHLAHPLGVTCILITSDNYLVSIKRSSTCADLPNMYELSGDHAEPKNLKTYTNENIVKEIISSTIDEYVNETNVDRNSPLIASDFYIVVLMRS
ncbi:unnamed protein product [Rotaria sp. Silwood1]|nr:unnamed protein product [Rotaria sp. Silwood1]